MSSKVCSRCGVEKPEDQYYHRRNGYIYQMCDRCRLDKRNEWTKRNKGKIKAYKEKPQAKERLKAWYEANPGKAFELNLRRYGITPTDYLNLLEVQKGLCAVCLQPATGGKNSASRLNVDHDHKTGVVRGLLCTNCNTAIGLMKDSPDRLRAAAMYLAQFD